MTDKDSSAAGSKPMTPFVHTRPAVNEVHSNDNQIFDNVDYQLSQDMHQEEHLDSDAETEIDDNTIPNLKAATADLHKDLLGTRNPGLGYIAKRAQPVLYDADTLLHPAHHPVRIWDSEDVLVHQVMRSLREVSEWMDSKAVENNAILKTELCGKRSRLDSTPSGENQVLASGMYNKTVQVRFTSKKRPLVWKATRNHNVNTTKTAWRPTRKVVGSVKPQWKPTGRHFALYDNCPLTRIMEPIVEPLELTPGRGIRGTSLSRAGKPVKKVLLMNLSDHRCSIHTVIIDPHGIRANGDLKVSDARHGISLLTYLRIKLVLNTKLRTNSEIHVSSNANCYGV
ncbi:hypothetical protein Tco_0317589 [Tanacetum coccineum]